MALHILFTDSTLSQPVHINLRSYPLYIEYQLICSLACVGCSKSTANSMFHGKHKTDIGYQPNEYVALLLHRQISRHVGTKVSRRSASRTSELLLMNKMYARQTQ